MKKRYTLISNDEKQPIAFIDWDKSRGTALCREVISWGRSDDGTYREPLETMFVADVFGKWDSCTHWRFLGEDYDEVSEDEIDAYYHICGSHSLLGMMLYMAFIWEVLARNYEYDGYNYYRDNEKLNSVIENLLKDYEIVEEESNNEYTD